MSDELGLWTLPTGRRLETPGHDDPRYVGRVGVLQRAEEASTRLARRSMREIPEENIEGQGLELVDTTTGETFEVITARVDLDPKSSGAVAFVIRDSLIVPLRPLGWKPPVEVHQAGEIYGRPAHGKDRLGVIPATGYA
jgi:hypothetical protein